MTSVDSGVAQSPRKWLYRVVTLLLLLVPTGLAVVFFRELWWNIRVAVLLLSPAVMILLYVDPVCFDEDSFDKDSLLNVFDPDRFLEVPYRLSVH